MLYRICPFCETRTKNTEALAVELATKLSHPAWVTGHSEIAYKVSVSLSLLVWTLQMKADHAVVKPRYPNHGKNETTPIKKPLQFMTEKGKC